MEQPKQDKSKLLYDAVSKDYDIGSYDEFKTKLQSPEKRKAFYDGVGKEFALGTYDEFEAKVSPVKKKDEAQSSTSQKPSAVSSGSTTSLGGTKSKINPKTGFPTINPMPGIIPESFVDDTKAQPLPPSKSGITRPGFIEDKSKKPNEKRGYVSRTIADFATGSANLGVMAASTPELLAETIGEPIYDVFAKPQNAVAELFDVPWLKADSEKLKKVVGTKNYVKEHYQKEIQKNRELASKVDKQYENGIYDSFANGDLEGGFSQLSSSFFESLPTTAAMMLGGAYAKAPQLLAASTMLFGAGKNEELKKGQPQMSKTKRLANALGTGFFEGAYETLSSGSFGAAARGLIQKEGVKKGTTLLKDGIYDFITNAAKKSPLVTEVSTEGLSEWATTVSQNAVDVVTGVKPPDYNVFTGATDSFIAGGAGGLAFGGTIHGIKNLGTAQDKIAVKQNTKQIFKLQEEFNNPNLPKDIKSQINTKVDELIKTNQKIIQQGKKTVEDLHPSVRAKLIETIDNIETHEEKAKQIQLDGSLSKESKAILLNDLKIKYKEDTQTKQNILEGNHTPVDTLPLKEQDKIKKEALSQLTQELNPDGKKNITITNDMILKRANKLHEENSAKAEPKIDFNSLSLSEYNKFIGEAHEELINENVPATERTAKKIKEKAIELYNKSLEAPTETKEVIAEEEKATEKPEVNLPLNTPQTQETEVEAEVNLPQKATTTIKEALADTDKTFVFNGERGTITTDGQQVVFTTPDAIHELGNVDEIADTTLDEIGIEKESISINPDNSIEIDGEVYINPEVENKGKSIKKDKKGNYIVTLINSKGEKITFRGPQADEIVYKTKLKENEEVTPTTTATTTTEAKPQAEIQKQTEATKIEEEVQPKPTVNGTETQTTDSTDGDIRPGNNELEKGTIVEQKATPRKNTESSNDSREAEKSAAKQEVKSGKNTFVVSKKNGEYVVVQQKNGQGVNDKAKIKILEQYHAENNTYAKGERAFNENTEDLGFTEPRQAEEHILKNSENPSEIAEAITRIKENPLSEEETKDFTEQKIADGIKGVKLDKSAWQFGDKNNFVPQKGFSYFAKEKGRKIDDLAEEIDVTPEEILDFIKKYPRLSDYKKVSLADNLPFELEQKFKSLTGVNPTNKVLAQAIQQANQLSDLHSSLDAMNEEQLEALYNEREQFENEQNESNKKSKPKPRPKGTEQTNEDSSDNQDSEQEPSISGQNFEEKPGVKSITKRLLEGGNSEDVTNAVAATNLNYEVDNQTQTWNKVADLFKDFNSFEMYQAIKNGTITNPSAITAAYGQLLEQMPTDIDKELSKITNEEDQETVKRILWDEYGRIVDEFATRATEFGQANAMVNKVIQMAEKVRYNLKRQSDSYKAANNGVMEPEMQRTFEETDAKLKEIYDKEKTLEKEKIEQEAQRALENMQEEIARQKANTPKQKAKDLANKIREIKIHKPNSFSAATPASLAWDLGVETIAKTVEAGGTITEAIQNGLEKIKETKWFKSLSDAQQKDAESDFNATFTHDKKGNVKHAGKTLTTASGAEFSSNLFRHYVEEGIKDIDEIAEQIKKDISDEYPDVDVREIRDALSGYGKTQNPSKDEIVKEMARQRTIGKLLSAKEDVILGEMPQKSGFLKAKPDADARALRKEINAIMKEKGLDTEDLEKKWASALTKIKNSLNNQIEELDKQIAAGEKRKVDRTPTELDQEAKDLKAKRDLKRKQLDELVGKPELTPEQKIKRAENALENAIKKLQEQINLGEFDAKKKNEPLNSEKLTKLREQQKELLAQKKQIQTESGAVEKARLEAAKKRVKTQLQELERRIKEKDFSKKEIKPVRADEELRKLKEDKIRLFEVYDAAKYKAELENRTNVQKGADAAMEVINVMRISSGLDLGLMFLQLGPLTVSRRVTNPVLFAKDLVRIARSIGSEKYSKEMNAKLKAREYYPLAEECKLALTSVDYKLSIAEDKFTGDLTNLIWNSPLALTEAASEKAATVLNKERTVFGDWLLGRKNGDKLSIIQQWKNSNIYPAVERGLVTYANIIRMQEFERGVEMLRIEGKNQEDHLGDYKKVAAAVNTLTGRANLPKSAAGVNKFLTALFFSPKNAVAIVNQVNPFWYMSLQLDPETGKFKTKPTAATKLAVHNMLRYVAITTTFALLVKAAYGDDAEEMEWDPRSYNAGKIIIKGDKGNKISFDPFSGKYHQISMFTKFILEQTKDIHTGKMTSLDKAKRGSKNRGELIGEFLSNKFSPAASFGFNYLTAKEEVINGEKTKVNRYTGEPVLETFFPSLAPMYWSSLYEIHQEDPDALTEFLGATTVFGVNTAIIKRPKNKKSKSSSRGRSSSSRGR